MSYDNTNRGTLGKNKRREKDSHPEYTGKINVEGREFWLSAWVKESGGEKFFSLSLKAKDEQPKPARGGSANRVAADLSDEIPFGPEWR